MTDDKDSNTISNVTPISGQLSAERQPNTRKILLDEHEIQSLIDSKVIEMNGKFTHVVNNGKNYITRIGKNALNQPYLEFFSIHEFKDMLSHERPMLVDYSKTGEAKTKPVADVWLKNENANLCSEGITFHPVMDRFYNGKLNSYFGLAATPSSYEITDIAAYLLHIELIICDANSECYEYLINWLAHMIQKPEEKPEVAIIMRAGQGTGKGTFVDPVGRIIGAHFVHLTEQSQLVGRFNSLLENRILIFADEFFAGSKRHTDQLKGMITEITAKIERKGVDSIIVPSFSRLIMASNHENIVSIEKDERRYLYLEVNEDKKQDLDYFAKLRMVMNSPSFDGKLLTFLMERDISKFNPRAVPKTKALSEQKIDNLKPLEQWLYAKLKDGSFNGSEWPKRDTSSAITDNAEFWLNAKHLEVWGDTSRKLGRLLSDIGFEKKRVRIGNNLQWSWEIPNLEICQQNFSTYLNANIEF